MDHRQFGLLAEGEEDPNPRPHKNDRLIVAGFPLLVPIIKPDRVLSAFHVNILEMKWKFSFRDPF